ncbi:bone marrow stromal antigen 2 [Suricata suricatta]|uniref:Bone marrow stromal antigen 2 n=1 Tax=Suricata suricatta TaxID=37032 RepID=A0A673TPE8_SURSU|nr:bone marrow stromal antigen 2 [Suricata suricatta]
MAPTFYHYLPVSRTECSESMLSGWSLGWRGWLGGFLILAVVLGLSVGLIISVHSKACKDGLLAEQECHNATRLLEVRLTQTQEVLQRTQAQAATCNETLVTLSASLEMEKAQGQEWRAKEEELRGEIEELKRRLQNALEEVERLRKENEASSPEKETTSASSPSKALSTLVAPGHLLLVLSVLLT